MPSSTVHRRRRRDRRHPALRWLTPGTASWGLLAAAVVAVTILGVVAFTRYQQAAGVLEPLSTRIYLAIQLFVLESGAVAGNVPWELEVARFAAPLVAAYAVVQAVLVVFREQVDALRLWLARDHVIVVGLGRKGQLLVPELLRRGHDVVAIEADGARTGLATVRALGGLVVVGDARNPDTLERAGVDRAGHLVALCADDSTNAEIVAAAQQQADAHRAGTLHCVAHIREPGLCLLLTGTDVARPGQEPTRADYVNTHAVAAQAVMRAHPPWSDDDPDTEAVVIGTGPTARELLVTLVRAAVRWSGDARRRVTVVGAADLADLGLPAPGPEVEGAVDLRLEPDVDAVPASPSTVYVCMDDDMASTRAALRLHGVLDAASTIVVVLEQASSLADRLTGMSGDPGAPRLAVMGMLDEACQPEVMLRGTTELLARALHRAYLDAAGTDGTRRADDAAMRPWEELADSLRTSNRDQAEHVGTKLAAVGRVLVPLVAWQAVGEPFTDDEVEVMAQLEHDRWVAERRRGGWRSGPRDSSARTTPWLVAWEDLPEDIRDYDRMFVRHLPDLLARVGLQAGHRGVRDRTNHLTGQRATGMLMEPVGPPAAPRGSIGRSRHGIH
jgi:voltage-gated potassium channel Kch